MDANAIGAAEGRGAPVSRPEGPEVPVELRRGACPVSMCQGRLAPISSPQFRNHKVVYRRYAGLFFCICVDANDNELAYLEAIHLFVEVLGALSRLCPERCFLVSVPDCSIPLKTHSLTTSASLIWCLTSTRYGPNFLLYARVERQIGVRHPGRGLPSGRDRRDEQRRRTRKTGAAGEA